MICAGYGKYFSKCTNKPVMRGRHYWCKRCDDLRKKKISDSLADIVQGFENYMRDPK